jgi:thioredoxin reductase (NADPH)
MGLPRYDKLPEPMPEEQRLREAPVPTDWEVIVVGGGFAGLSAAIYLGRAMRRVLVLDGEESLGCWEPEVQNYFGFPEGISGAELLRRGREQARNFGAEILVDEVEAARIAENGEIFVRGRHVEFRCKRLLLATGLYHLPPKFDGMNECIGHSLFFCKDCDGYKVRDKAIAVVGHNNATVDYALGLTLYSPTVVIATNGERATWDAQHARWIEEHEIPVYGGRIERVEHSNGMCAALHFEDGKLAKLDFVFTTRGDIFYNEIAKQLGVKLDSEGQIIVGSCQETNVRNVFAAGCVTQANCQMIIAAGGGAAAAQAINRSLFEESLANHSLKRRRVQQIKAEETEPEVVQKSE